MKTESKPASSARQAKPRSSRGPNCSADALYPSLSMQVHYHARLRGETSSCCDHVRLVRPGRGCQPDEKHSWSGELVEQGIGARLTRKEDDRLMRGRGQYVADIRLAGMQDVAF